MIWSGNVRSIAGQFNVIERVYITQFCYLAGCASLQGEQNPAVWLATLTGKRELSCSLQIARQRKFSQKPDHEWFRL